MEEGASASATAAAYLPDDLVVDILARLPAKSLCRFKCVSRRCRSLISDPAHRARLAQTLSGFFFVSRAPAWRFAVLQSSVTPPGGDGGPPPVDTSLSFLPPSCGEIKMLDSCNGLLLLRCSSERPRRPPPPFLLEITYLSDTVFTFRALRSASPFYVVCNPATREWWPCRDRVSSHFYVFQMVVVDYTTECYLEAVEIYSSETGAWIMSEMGRGDAYFGAFMHHMTYFNGSLHLTRDSDAVASVGAKGRSWRITHVLRREEDHIITMGVHT
ncbi:putative F-box protein At2g16220 [Panicum hallii]|uniref:putative F-box protein At2g16220 n=1 Tax=Panicum hallii TaxID=206008 RepID=UPI000DF4DD1B|nr:putative F-box protein At2g16220 [Panicum hallii]